MALRFMKELCVGEMVRTAIVCLLGGQKKIEMEAGGIWLRRNKVKCFGAKTYLIPENDFED